MLNIEKIKDNDIIIVKVSGKMLDTASIQLTEIVKELISKGHTKIILDLNGITLLNSCYGLGIIAACWGYLNKVDGQFRIAQPSKKVAQLLEITKLDQIIEIHEGIEEAKTSFI